MTTVTGVQMAGLLKAVNLLDLDQLRDLNGLVLTRMAALLPSAKRHPPVSRSAFRRGDLIGFVAKDGRSIKAAITRLNEKTISCMDVETKGKWRVSYSLARLVGADKVVTPLEPMKLHSFTEPGVLTPTGGACTAEDGGSW